MKRNMIFWAGYVLAAVAALSMAACSSEEFADDMSGQEEAIDVVALARKVKEAKAVQQKHMPVLQRFYEVQQYNHEGGGLTRLQLKANGINADALEFAMEDMAAQGVELMHACGLKDREIADLHPVQSTYSYALTGVVLTALLDDVEPTTAENGEPYIEAKAVNWEKLRDCSLSLLGIDIVGDIARAYLNGEKLSKKLIMKVLRKTAKTAARTLAGASTGYGTALVATGYLYLCYKR